MRSGTTLRREADEAADAVEVAVVGEKPYAGFK